MGMPFLMKMANFACRLDSLHLILSPVLVRQEKTITRMKISSLQVTKEIQLVKKPEDKDWYGIANLVADRTPAVGRTFTTSFNTGHGKKWFVDGKVSKDSEWNYRSVSGILPTWRWWQTSSGAKLQADYDFEDAYNGGNSLKFAGDLAENTNQDVRLYSTKLEVTDKTKLRVAHKGGKGSKVYVEFATQKNYTYGGENRS